MRMQIEVDEKGKITGQVVDQNGTASVPPAQLRDEPKDDAGSNQAPAPVFQQQFHENETPEQFQQRVERHHNLRRETERQRAQSGRGTIDLDSLTPEDKMYLRHAFEHAQHKFQQAGRRQPPNMWQEILGGSQDDINRVIGSQDDTELQPVRERFMKDQAAWVAAYTGTRPAIPRAFHAWMSTHGIR